MKVILDTNVFISGVFFSGPSHRILQAWRDGRLQLVISSDILEEYCRVGDTLAERFPGVDLRPLLDLITIHAELYACPPLPQPVCSDRDDDKFIACALASQCDVLVSGDRHLLEVAGYRGLRIMKPRDFVDDFLSGGLE